MQLEHKVTDVEDLLGLHNQPTTNLQVHQTSIEALRSLMRCPEKALHVYVLFVDKPIPVSSSVAGSYSFDVLRGGETLTGLRLPTDELVQGCVQIGEFDVQHPDKVTWHTLETFSSPKGSGRDVSFLGHTSAGGQIGIVMPHLNPLRVLITRSSTPLRQIGFLSGIMKTEHRKTLLLPPHAYRFWKTHEHQLIPQSNGPCVYKNVQRNKL